MSTPNQLDRRSFLRSAGFASALLPSAAMMASAEELFETGGNSDRKGGDISLPKDDVDILLFLAAAEAVETDLWNQYAELALNNPRYQAALRQIDPALPNYISADATNEGSHFNFIFAFLKAAGEKQAVQTLKSLSTFATLPSAAATGAQQKGRLTNLKALTVDTSYYTRYRSFPSPDKGVAFPQIATITAQPTVPTSDTLSDTEMATVAQAAAFHFASVDQGGSSLYTSLLPYVRDERTVSILAAIGPIEVFQFATFSTSLQGIRAISGSTIDFPDLVNIPESSRSSIPVPARYNPRNEADRVFPLTAVIRPNTRKFGGAVAAATSLAKSGLFTGQPAPFLNAVVGLAKAADRV